MGALLLGMAGWLDAMRGRASARSLRPDDAQLLAAWRRGPLPPSGRSPQISHRPQNVQHNNTGEVCDVWGGYCVMSSLCVFVCVMFSLCYAVM